MNNIVIGLGGTGGNIIKFLKRKIELDSHVNKDNIFIDYLYIDSDMSLTDNKSEWKILGKDISLGNANIIPLEYQDMNAIFANPDNYRHITNWLGDKDDWKPVLANFIGMGKVYGQQKRRLGRFLFASSANNFATSVDNIVQSLQDKAESTDTTFYICSGLSGGTGSGSLIDAIVQVKKLYPKSEIMLFLFLPERNPGDKDAGNYHLNAYATLKELNDLSAGNWKPHDLTSSRGERTTESNFFKKAYIITDENRNSVRLNASSAKPEESLADFIHQRVVGSSEYITKIEDSENIKAGAETEGSDSKNPIPVRSRSFITFGIKRVIFPQEEIKEYLTYKSSYSLLLSVLYNNWNEQKSAFVDENKSLNINEVLDDAFKLRIKFTDKTLTLAEGVLDNEKRFITFSREWDNQLDRIKESQDRQGMSVKEKFTNISKMFEAYYANRFRGKDIGVVRFFENARADAQARADAMVQLIERLFFDSWIYRDKYSINNLEDIINALFGLIDSEIDNLTQKRTKAFYNITKFENEKNDIAERFRNAGMFTSKSKIYDNYENALKSYYLSMTQEKALDYAVSTLLPLLKDKISFLLRDIQKTKTNFTELKNDMNEKYSARLKSSTDDNKTIYKVFNKKLIDEVLNRTVINNHIQHNVLKTTIQQQIRDRLGADNFSFRDLNEKFNRYLFLSFLEKTLSIDVIAQVHQDTNITNKNIIDELEMQYRGNDHKLNELVIKTMASAEEFLPFNTTEVGRYSPITGSTIKAKAEKQILILPLSSSESINENFRKNLRNTFDKQKKANTNVYHTVDELYKNGTAINDINVNQNEILLIKAVSTFPLRIVERVKFLSDKYEEGHRENSKIDLEIHLEGGRDDYSNLFIPDRDEFQEKSIENLLLLFATDNLEKDDDGKYQVEITDEYGIPSEIITLSAEVRTLHKNLDYNNSLTIKSKTEEITDELIKMTKSLKEGKKKEIIKSLASESQVIQKECSQTGDDKLLWGKRFRMAIDKIKDI